METDPEVVAREIAHAVRAGRRTIAFTGAGASAESGVRPFRAPGATGALWSGLALLGLPLAGDGRAWHAWPRVAHFFFRHFFLAGELAAAPNPCHTFLADCGVVVVTTNVDGLHERAGTPPEQVAAVHGTVLEEVCAGCGWPLDACLRAHPCCGYPRPAVLLFRDSIHPAVAVAAGGRAADLVHAVHGFDTPLLLVVGARVIHVNLAAPPAGVAAPGDTWVCEAAGVFFQRCREAYFM